MLPLAFHPTAVIGLDKNLEVAQWEIFSRGNPKLYANPPSFESEKEVVMLAKPIALSISKKEDEPEKPEVVPKEVPEPEDNWELLKNPSRVTLNQIKGIDFSISERYRPVTGEVFHGFVMLKEVDGHEEDDSGE
jgi:26S proteasome regulatory subunit N2